MTSSMKLPRVESRPWALLNVNRVTVEVATYTPVYVSHSAWPPLVAMVLDVTPVRSPRPLDVVRVAPCAVSLPGLPIMTCMESTWDASSLACFRLHRYMTPGVVAMSW